MARRGKPVRRQGGAAVRAASAPGARGPAAGHRGDRLSRLRQDHADPRPARHPRGRQHRDRRQRVRRDRHRPGLAAREQRRDRAARQRVPVLQCAHRSAGNPARAVRRPRPRCCAELCAGDRRNLGLGRSGADPADFCHRPRARPRVPSAGAGRPSSTRSPAPAISTTCPKRQSRWRSPTASS